MPKTVTKPSKGFTATDYTATVSALVKAGTAIDKAINNRAATVNAWALASAVGIKTKALTLDDVKAKLIAATPLAIRKANNAANGDSVDSIAACGSTLKGWFYALQRIEKAGVLDRIIKGEAFNTLARSVGTVQKQKPGKRAANSNNAPTGKSGGQKAESAAHVPSATPLSDIVTALVAELKRLSVPTMAKSYQPDIARAMAALSAASLKIEAHVAAKANRTSRAATAKDVLRKAA